MSQQVCLSSDLILQITGGPRNGEQISVNTPKCFLGTAPAANNVHPEDPSKSECAIFRGPHGAILRSYGDGVIVNGESKSAHLLAQGDEIQFSNSLKVEVSQLGSIENDEPAFESAKEPTPSGLDYTANIDGWENYSCEMPAPPENESSDLVMTPYNPPSTPSAPERSDARVDLAAQKKLDQLESQIGEIKEQNRSVQDQFCTLDQRLAQLTDQISTLVSVASSSPVLNRAATETVVDLPIQQETMTEFVAPESGAAPEIESDHETNLEAPGDVSSEAPEVQENEVQAETSNSQEIADYLKSFAPEPDTTAQEELHSESTESTSVDSVTESVAPAETPSLGPDLAAIRNALKNVTENEAEEVPSPNGASQEVPSPNGASQEETQPTTTSTRAAAATIVTAEEKAVAKEWAHIEGSNDSFSLGSVLQSDAPEDLGISGEPGVDSHAVSSVPESASPEAAEDDSEVESILDRLQNASVQNQLTHDMQPSDSLESQLGDTMSEPATQSAGLLSGLADELLSELSEEIKQNPLQTPVNETTDVDPSPVATETPDDSPESTEPETPRESVADLLTRMKTEGQWESVDEDAEDTEDTAEMSTEPPTESVVAEVPPESESANNTSQPDVDDYMSQLLTRMRGGATPVPPKTDTKSEKEKTDETPVKKPAPQAPVELLKPEEYVPKSKAAKIESLSAMRELANSTARTAVHSSEVGKRQLQGYMKLIIGVAALILSGYYFGLVSQALMDTGFLIGSVCVLVAGTLALFSFRDLASVKQLTVSDGGQATEPAKQNPATEPAEIEPASDQQS